MKREVITGAISGTMCAVGVVVMAANLLQSSEVTASVLCIVGSCLFCVGCMIGAVGAWR